jgi:hypothetical protein
MRTTIDARTVREASPAMQCAKSFQLIGRCIFLMMLAASPCTAQLTIVNPKQLQVPEEKGNVVLSTACRVVAEEYRVSDPSALRLSLVLVRKEARIQALHEGVG